MGTIPLFVWMTRAGRHLFSIPWGTVVGCGSLCRFETTPLLALVIFVSNECVPVYVPYRCVPYSLVWLPPCCFLAFLRCNACIGFDHVFKCCFLIREISQFTRTAVEALIWCIVY